MANNGDEKIKGKKTAVKFSRAYSAFFCFLCGICAKFLRAKFIRSKAFEEQKKKGAMLVVANHLSAYDFIYFSRSMKGVPLNFVVAENMMYSTPIFATLIKSYHAITKKQFTADVQCIKSIKRYLDAGISVLICPEGKVSADGMTGTIPPAIAKLVQWLGYPVGCLKLQGASIARPKWAHNLRKGRVQINCDMLFEKDELKAISKEDILQKIERAISHNEHKWQIENDITFKGKHYAEGLHKLLYRCEKCNKEFEMTSKDSHIICNNCGNDVVYLNDGKLMPNGENDVCPSRIDEWYINERKCVTEQIKSDDFRLSNKVNLFIENTKNNGYKFIAAGTITLDKEAITFTTDWNIRPSKVKTKYGVNTMDYDFCGQKRLELVEDEFKNLCFPIKQYDTIAFNPGISIDLYDQSHVYRFMFEQSTKFAIAVEELFLSR